MPQLNNVLLQGYGAAVAVLAMVTAYYALVALVVRWRGPPHVFGSSLPAAFRCLARDRSMAVGIQSGASSSSRAGQQGGEGLRENEQREDLCSVTQLQTQCTAPLEPEEDALSYRLFRVYDAFDFDELNPHMIRFARMWDGRFPDGLPRARVYCRP